MKLTMYISAEQIQAIGYKGKKVLQMETFPLPEGTMFNGNIMDAPFLAECLASMKKDFPKMFKGGASLVVDGSSILTRRLTVPKLSHKQYLQRVRDDFVDSISDTNDMVAAYKKQHGGTILGCCVNKAQVDSYIDTFKAAGIKLTGIHVGAEMLNSLVKATPQLQQATVVLNLLDGQTMLSAIFVKGNNIMTQRTRLYGDEKEQIFTQINDSLSNLNQFVQSQKHDEITQSFYLGLRVSDVRTLGERNTHEGIRINPLTLYKGAVDIPPEAHFACLNMQYGRNAINLIAARRTLNRYIKSKRPKKIWIPALAVYAAVMIGVAAYFWLELRDVNIRIDELNNFIMDPDTIEMQTELAALMGERDKVLRIAHQFNNRLDWEETMPIAVSHMVNQIVFGHGINVRVNTFEFNEVTGVVRVNATTPDATVANDYVHSLLNELKVARQVNYTGFTTGTDGFSFSVDIVLMLEGVE
jgi:hypothetical protein